MRKERWKNISGYEGLYQVSSLGRVKRLATTLTRPNRWRKDAKIKLKERIHKYHIAYNGYARVELSKNGKQKIFSMHRLVASAFIPNNENYPIVCHKDDNPLNNLVSNLFWGTQKDNMEDKCYKGRQATGSKSGNSVLTERQVIEIRKKYIPIKYGSVKIGKEYNVSSTNIHSIIKRKTWRHI